MRIGQGYDIHRLAEGRKLILGGREIPSEKGEAAHSDGDALLHAITDAVLGAVADGDIGSHFPPSDMKWKDADSAELLREVLRLHPVKIHNLDSTVFLERPKLRPHVDAIRSSIASIMGIDVSKVSVKAKTAEGILGELGSGDAVACSATILID